MPSTREIRRKIKSVKSTEKITKAMKVVSAARMRRAQQAILASRPFAVKMEAVVRELALLEVKADIQAGREVQIHPFFDVRTEGKAALILVSGDKGLCGSFNANAIRAGIDWVRRHQDRPVALAAVGKKSRDFIHRVKVGAPELLTELAGIFPKVTFAHAELLGKAIIEAYLDGRLAKVSVIYNEFKSIATQKVVETQLLPIPVPEAASQKPSEAALPGLSRVPQGDRIAFGEEFKFEPGREELLGALLPRYVKAQLYRILLESQAAELAARMNAMDAASKNAKELIAAITLKLNRTRQAIITNEIAELVGGAEALAS